MSQPSATSQPPAAPQPEAADLPDPRTTRRLKILVATLGVLILAAFAGVVYGMVYRAGKIGTASPAAPNRATAHGTSLLPAARLSLPAGAQIRSTAFDGTRVLIHHDGPAGAGLVVLDLTTGQVVSRIEIEGAPPTSR